MIRKILISVFGFLAICFAGLTLMAMRLDYNEMGNYFDGENSYDSDAIVAYGMLAGLFFLATVVVFLVSRRSG